MIIGNTIFHPTPMPLVLAMMDLAKFREDDVLMDLGSGDGRIVIAAAQRGIRSIGIEHSLVLIEKAQRAVAESGVASLIEFRNENIHTADLSEATVLTCFLDYEPLKMMARRFMRECRPGTRIISVKHDLWRWFDQIEIRTDEFWDRALIFEVPA